MNFYYTIWFNKFKNKLNKIKVIPNLEIYKVNPYLLYNPIGLSDKIINDISVKNKLIEHFKSINNLQYKLHTGFFKDKYVFRLESMCNADIKYFISMGRFDKISTMSSIDHFIDDLRLESYCISTIKDSPVLETEIKNDNFDSNIHKWLSNIKLYDKYTLDNVELHNLYLRKFIPLKLDEGFPVEFRCVFKEGKLISICNYYIQRVMSNFNEYSKNLIELIKEEIEPLMSESIILDFALSEDNNYYFIDSNPCLSTNLSDPCSFRNRYEELKNHFDNFDGETILTSNDFIKIGEK